MDVYERTGNRGQRPKQVVIVYQDEYVVVFRTAHPKSYRTGVDFVYEDYRMVTPKRFKTLYKTDSNG